jgi:hypothetical protein
MMHSKKWISSALVFSLSIGLSACGNTNDKKKEKASANLQWSNGAACPKEVVDELLAATASVTDEMTLEQRIEAKEKEIPLAEAFYKKFLGRPTCKAEITTPAFGFEVNEEATVAGRVLLPVFTVANASSAAAACVGAM